MKYIFFAAICCTFLPLNAQVKDDCERDQPNSVRTQKATALLDDCMADINELNGRITTCLAVGVKSSELNAYSDRLINAEKILSKLEITDAKFTCLTEDNPEEADYFVKDAYTKITMLSIISRKSDYLDFLRLVNYMSPDMRQQLPYADPGKAYDVKSKEWTLKEKKLDRETKGLLRNIQDIDVNNTDASVIKLILEYYENLPTAENNFYVMLTKLKDHAAKINSVDPKIGFVESWLAYIKINKRKFNEAESLVDSIRILSEPEKSITWAEQTSTCLDSKLTSGSSIFPISYNLPDEKAHFDKYTVKYEKELSNKKIGPAFALIDEEVRVDNLQPQVLIADLQSDWDKLLGLENEVQLRAQKALENGLKSSFKDPNYTYYVKFSDLTKKKDIENQCLLYRDRFDKALPVVQNFIYQRKAWTSLVNENNNELFYRLMRIKADLALVYVKQHQQSFTGFLDYYKLDKKLISDEDKNVINQIFSQSGIEAEINEDLQSCSKMDSNDILTTISKIENIQYSEESTKGIHDLSDLKKNTPPGLNINGVWVKSLLAQAMAYLYFKGNYGSKLKNQVEDMADYTNLDKAKKIMTTYYKYKENEQNTRNGTSSR